jgi:hypothetical protein
MKLTLAFLTVMASVLLMDSGAVSARADEPRLQSFFSALEGDWDGSGVVHQIDSAGNPQTASYTLQISAQASGLDGTWTITNQLTSDSGATSQNSGTYVVKGDLLLISGPSGTTEPVQIVESSPTTLTYSFQRADAVTGRTYVFTFHTALGAQGDTLKGHNKIETNGVAVMDETFTAKRW